MSTPTIFGGGQQEKLLDGGGRWGCNRREGNGVERKKWHEIGDAGWIGRHLGHGGGR